LFVVCCFLRVTSSYSAVKVRANKFALELRNNSRAVWFVLIYTNAPRSLPTHHWKQTLVCHHRLNGYFQKIPYAFGNGLPDKKSPVHIHRAAISLS